MRLFINAAITLCFSFGLLLTGLAIAGAVWRAVA